MCKSTLLNKVILNVKWLPFQFSSANAMGSIKVFQKNVDCQINAKNVNVFEDLKKLNPIWHI